MAGDRQLLLSWDADLDGAFRRRLERALGALNVNAADAAAVDVDPDAPAPVRLALVSASGGSLQGSADIVVQAGPGEFPKVARALRLETSDIEHQSRRWSAFVDQLRSRLGRASLALAPEDLEVRLDEAARRADEAERGLADMERQRNDALRAARHAETSLVAERVRLSDAEREIRRLSALTESTVFALSSTPADLRDLLAQARDHSWRGRLAAARADEAAATHPDALTFAGARAIYSGETTNKLAHGFGAMTFREGLAVIAIYRGGFEHGRRTGHGVAASGGLNWSGQWKDNEACGFGILETPDGRRFEGEVAPDATGAPRQVRGWTWEADKHVATDPHRPVAPLLPSPATQAAGG